MNEWVPCWSSQFIGCVMLASGREDVILLRLL
jgi:hypothetical protein